MREVTDGIFHWSVLHQPIDQEVSSYLIAPAGVVIDPKVPAGGMDDLPHEPKLILLTSGHHGRDARRFASAFDIPIRASRAAAERLGDALEVEPFEEGEEVAEGITPLRVGALAPDEGAVHIAVGGGALAVADGVHRYGRDLAFFPDSLLGDDPDRVKLELQDAYSSLLTYEFEHLLVAHGDPVIGDGKAALRDFTTARTD